jgi:ethanolamine kinase
VCRYIEEIPSIKELQKELNEITEQLESMKTPIVFSHNDLLLKNIVYDDKQCKYGARRFLIGF